MHGSAAGAPTPHPGLQPALRAFIEGLELAALIERLQVTLAGSVDQVRRPVRPEAATEREKTAEDKAGGWWSIHQSRQAPEQPRIGGVISGAHNARVRLTRTAAPKRVQQQRRGVIRRCRLSELAQSCNKGHNPDHRQQITAWLKAPT